MSTANESNFNKKKEVYLSDLKNYISLVDNLSYDSATKETGLAEIQFKMLQTFVGFNQYLGSIKEFITE